MLYNASHCIARGLKIYVLIFYIFIFNALNFAETYLHSYYCYLILLGFNILIH